MAIGATVKASLQTAAPREGVTFPGSAYAGWVQIHDDLTAAADTAVLMHPWSIANANMHPLVIGPGVTRVILMARCPSSRTVTTKPTLRLWSFHGTTIDDTGANGPSGLRIDIGGGKAASTGFVLPFDTTQANCWVDTNYRYSDPYDLTGFDAKAGQTILTFVETACVLNITGAVTLWALPLN